MSTYPVVGVTIRLFHLIPFAYNKGRIGAPLTYRTKPDCFTDATGRDDNKSLLCRKQSRQLLITHRNNSTIRVHADKPDMSIVCLVLDQWLS